MVLRQLKLFFAATLVCAFAIAPTAVHARGEYEAEAYARPIRKAKNAQGAGNQLQNNGNDAANTDSGSSNSGMSEDTKMVVIIVSSIAAGLGLTLCWKCMGWPGCRCMQETERGRPFGCAPFSC
jgi:hypothetical protein